MRRIVRKTQGRERFKYRFQFDALAHLPLLEPDPAVLSQQAHAPPSAAEDRAIDLARAMHCKQGG